MKIVVVEDEEKTRQGIIRLIQKCSDTYRIVGESDNGLEGARLIAALQPDLVITDIRMPGMDGIGMLEKLKADGVKTKAVILSGYSEFDFARRALQTGVVGEYLLKPITADDLFRVLKHAEKEVLKELITGRETIPSEQGPEQLIQRYLEQSDVDNELFDLHILQFLDFEPMVEIQLVNLYVGEVHRKRLHEIEKQVRHFLEKEMPSARTCLTALSRQSELILLVQQEAGQELKPLLKKLWEQLNAKSFDAVITWMSSWDLRNLQTDVGALRESQRWAIVRGEMPLFPCGYGQDIPLLGASYPADIEQRMKDALSGRDREKLMASTNELLNFCVKQVQEPQAVTEICNRFSSSMLHLGEALSGNAIMTSERTAIFDRLTAARTRQELERALHRAADYVSQHFGNETRALSLVITKAMKAIQERYHTGVSLEELANGCHVTPEYLSSLFQKELGKPFTAYIRDVRITKAKELLINSTLKSFEIAERVGYLDAKYFSKVFKEATGLTPREFQNLHV